MQFLLIIVGLVFLFGLIQWARSGAVLWDILRLSKYRPSSRTAGTVETAETEATEKKLDEKDEKELLRKSIHKLELTMDEFLRSSFRVLGILAIGVWIFVVASVVMDMLGLDWLARLSFTANRIIGNPTVRASYNSPRSAESGRRSEAIRSMGSNMRRQEGNRR